MGDLPKPAYINLNRARDNQKFALQMLVDHGITAYRMTKDGQIAWIKHATFGWMNVRTFWILSKVKELPWEEIIQGGYRFNQALYGLNFNVGIRGVSVPLPIGPAVVIATLGAIVFSINRGDFATAAQLGAALTLPFGAAYLMYLFITGLAEEFRGLDFRTPEQQAGQGPIEFGNFDQANDWWGGLFRTITGA